MVKIAGSELGPRHVIAFLIASFVLGLTCTPLRAQYCGPNGCNIRPITDVTIESGVSCKDARLVEGVAPKQVALRIPEAVAEAAKNAVRIRFGRYGGSGCYLGEKLVSTAYHVPRGTNGRGVVTFRDGSKINCNVILNDKVWDVAICELDSEHPSLPGVRFAGRNPRTGEACFSVGFGKGFRIFGGRKTQGWSRPNSRPATTDWFNHESGAVSGDSGGPVFTETGMLIGPLWGTTGRTTIATGSAKFCQVFRPLFPRIANWRANRRRLGIGVIGGGHNYGGGYGGSGDVGVIGGGDPTPDEPLPPPIGVYPEPDPTPNVEISYDKLAEALLPKLAVDGRFRGPQGSMGPGGPPGVPGPKGDDGETPDVELDYTKLVQMLVPKIANEPSLKGPQGDPGQPGEPGPQGQVDVAQIVAAVDDAVNRLDLSTRIVVRQDGQTIDDETYRLGEPIVLDVSQLVKNK